MRYETLDFVFCETDGPQVLFVEVEDSTGKSVRCGEWVDRGDGYYVLRVRVHHSSIAPPVAPPASAAASKECPNHYCHDGWIAWGNNPSGGAPAWPCRHEKCPHRQNQKKDA